MQSILAIARSKRLPNPTWWQRASAQRRKAIAASALVLTITLAIGAIFALRSGALFSKPKQPRSLAVLPVLLDCDALCAPR